MEQTSNLRHGNRECTAHLFVLMHELNAYFHYSALTACSRYLKKKKDISREMSSIEGVGEHTVPLLLKGKGAITLTGDSHEVPSGFFLPSGSVVKA